MTIKVYNNGWDKVADGGVSPDVQPIRQTINLITLSLIEPDLGSIAALEVGQTITGETSNVTAVIQSWDEKTEITFSVYPASVNISADTITLSEYTDYDPTTGDILTYTPGTTPISTTDGDLSQATGTKYFVIRVDANTIKLASTLFNAINGINLDLTDPGTGTGIDIHKFTTKKTGTLTLINSSGTFILPEKITNGGSGSWTTTQTIETTGFLDTKLFSFVLLKSEFSSPCWFTLYTDAAARDADTRTDQYQDPLNSSGVLAEFITSSTDGTTSPYLNLCTPAPICIGDGTYILETTGVQYQRTSWSYPVIPGTDTNTLQPDDRYYMMKNSPQESFWVWDGQIIKTMSAGGDFTSPIIDGYMYVANIGIGGMVDSGTYDNPYTGGTDFSWNTWGISKHDVNTVGRTNLTWKARNHLGGAWTQNDIALTVVPMKDQGLANYDPIRAI
tara:strand:+ start:4237 stop:5577 length:1341 start_codon:yes stop_codon:yes gene_type:complete